MAGSDSGTARNCGSDWSIWLELQSLLTDVTHNWQQSRAYAASLDTRREGFTENWGEPPSNENQDRPSNKSVSQDSSEKDIDALSSADQILVHTRHPLPPAYQNKRNADGRHLTLVQYRPAWEEQLALRIAGIPHTVVNSTYAIRESTGPLPVLCDVSLNPKEDSRPPVLVGRSQGNIAPSGGEQTNAIFRYLHFAYNVEFLAQDDASLLGPTSDSENILFLNIIRNSLEPVLVALRYSDYVLYRQVYHKQSILAGVGHVKDEKTDEAYPDAGGGVWNAWQVRCERVHALRSITPHIRCLSTDQLLSLLRKTFAMFEHQLVSVSQRQGGIGDWSNTDRSGPTYLLGGKNPQLADVLLFGSLARALTDVHGVVVLADFPKLCSYVQCIWDTYFDKDQADSPPNFVGGRDAASWTHWNSVENARNAFGRLPFDRTYSKLLENGRFAHALQLMEQLSLQRHDLREQLLLVQETRESHSKRSASTSRSRRPFYTWYRWRMGDTLTNVKPARSKQASGVNRHEEKMKRDYRRNDELWLITVIAATASSILAFGFAGGGKRQG